MFTQLGSPNKPVSVIKVDLSACHAILLEGLHYEWRRSHWSTKNSVGIENNVSVSYALRRFNGTD